jgi:thiopeptide-type bacteriocin biosynthesis protein
VYYVEFDLELLLDLESPVAIDMLLTFVPKRATLKLKECLSTPENLVVKDEHGNAYCGEIVIPFVKTPKAQKVVKRETPVPAKSKAKIQAKRSFEPYSEWVYYKLYTGAKSVDKLLAEQVHKLASKLIAEKVIDKWFFIRYTDPHHHIRLRFHLTPAKDTTTLNRLLEKHLSSLVSMGIINNIQVATYQRELERYGADSIETVEDYFFHNSVCTAELMRLFNSDASQQYRFISGLLGVHRLYEAFGYDMATRMKLVEEGTLSFAKEFGVAQSAHLRDQIKDNYRKEMPMLDQLIGGKTTAQEIAFFKNVSALYSRQQKSLKPVNEKLRNGSFHKTLDELMPSMIHMFVNRFFNTNQRYHEMMIYQFLSKYYASLLAREKYAQKTG